MKTYTHKNGNTYNVNINGNSVVLTSDVQGICPLYITLENFNKLNEKESITVKGIEGDVEVFEGARLVISYRYGARGCTVIKVLKNKCIVHLDRSYKGVNEVSVSHGNIYHRI